MNEKLRPCFTEVYVSGKQKLGGHPGERTLGGFVRYEALFHQWGLEMDGEGNTYSIGIIEMPDGKIKTTTPERIVFTNKEQL